MRILALRLLVALVLPWSSIASAQPDETEPKPVSPAIQVRPDQPGIAYEKVTINGEEVHYLVMAGTLTIATPGDHAKEGEPAASMFYTSYRALDEELPYADFRVRVEAVLGEDALAVFDRVRTTEGGDEAITAIARLTLERGVALDRVFPFHDAKDRAITFSFNGGPGSSSVWLHLGVFGPRRVQHIDDFGRPGPGPHGVVPNPYSLLDKSDFVFIDPVSTGYSRAEGEADPRDFHGVEPDIDTVAEFIRLFLTREERWRSPRFIAGESYGTTRAAGLSLELFENHGISLNGVLLVSTVLNFQTIRFDIGNDLPYILILPSYTATARFHGALDTGMMQRSLPEVLGEAEQFAMGEYATALLKGDTIGEEEYRRVAQRLSRYTGLSEEFIVRSRLRVPLARFAKELLREQGLTVGRLDSRFTARDRDEAGERYEFDASYAAILPIYTASLNAYLRERVGYETDLPYEILTGKVRPWSYARVGDNRYTNTGEDMRAAMTRQPEMKVFLASGLYDLATPYLASDHTMSHLMLPPELRGNIETRYYEAGHMMYVHLPSLQKLKQDLDAWYDGILRRAAEVAPSP